MQLQRVRSDYCLTTDSVASDIEEQQKKAKKEKGAKGDAPNAKPVKKDK